MIKPLLILSALAAVLGQDFDFTNNLIDFEDTPYQRISSPYRSHSYRENKLMNLWKKPIKNAIILNDGYEGIRRPTTVIDTGDVITSLANLQTSLTATITGFTANVLGGLKSALKLLTINIPAIIFGVFMTTAFCKITSFCSKIMSIKSAIESVKESISFVTVERLNAVSDFMEKLITRFGSLQMK